MAYLLHMHSIWDTWLLLRSIWSVIAWMIWLCYRNEIEWNTKMGFWGCQDNGKYTICNVACLLTFSQQHSGRSLWRPETWESQYLPFQGWILQSVIFFHCIMLFCMSACCISRSLLCTYPFQLGAVRAINHLQCNSLGFLSVAQKRSCTHVFRRRPPTPWKWFVAAVAHCVASCSSKSVWTRCSCLAPIPFI